MHAAAAESLLPYLQPGARILDIGSGSGYLTAVLANLVEPDGVVVGVDHISPLVALACGNVNKSEDGRRALGEGRIRFEKGDGRLGWVDEGKGGWDAIHVGAAAVEAHEVLVRQLKAPGRMFIPIGDEMEQHIWVIDKGADGKVERKKSFGVRYVPLTDAPE
jgi:protein-L-isoaspartate(D-aspartate) O-methyltransferase